MKITRIYADNGRSRFADVDIALDPIGPLLGVSSFRASAPISVERCTFMSSPPLVTEQHGAPRRQLVIVLSGELEIETNEGDIRRFRPGEVFLADDGTGGHILRTLSDLITTLVMPVASIPA
jgi:hypothetical protein